MDDTPLLALPLLAHKQALQTTFHDEAIKTLDALVMLSVLDRDLSSPPASPDEGARYIVKAPGSGHEAWVDNSVVVFVDGQWRRHEPRIGWTCYVQDEGALIAWDGSAWQPALDMLGGGAAQNLALLGVGTTADATNPFSAKLNNALWAARTVAEGGDGHLRYKMSKETAAKTLSILLQDNFSGRAEIGLTGDDDLHVKTSPDGTAWIEAAVIDRATGGLRFLANETNVASAATCDIGAAASLRVSITGTTSITSFGTQPYRLKFVRFNGVLTLTHHATSLVLLGGVSRTTAAGDCGIYASDASGNWRELAYDRASGAPVVVVSNAMLANMAEATAKGRALGAGTGAPVDLTAAQLAAIVGSVGGAMKSKLITLTRAMDATTGAVAYTGVGFQPAALILAGAVSHVGDAGGREFSVGFADSSGIEACVFNYAGGPTFFPMTGSIGNFAEDTSNVNFQRAEWSSYGADGFTLTWTKGGTPTAGNTIHAHVLALR